MFRKILCSCLCVMLLLTQAIGVFAAPSSYSVKTTYLTGEDSGKIKVETTVSGVAEGDQLTYLAYNTEVAAEPTSDNIVYIDQHEVKAAEVADNTTTYTFSYKTDSKNIGSTVKYGGVDVNGTGFNASSGKIPGITVKVSLNEAVSSDCAVTVGSGDFVKINFTYSNVITAVKKDETEVSTDNWFTANDGLWIKATEFDQNATYSVTTTEPTTGETTTAAINGVLREWNKGSNNKDILKAICTIAGNVTEYGIIISNSSDLTSENIGTPEDGENFSGTEEKSYIFKALGKSSDGKYIIAIEFEGAELFTKEAYYVYAYYKTADGAYVLSSKGLNFKKNSDDNTEAVEPEQADVSVMSAEDNTPEGDIDADTIIIEETEIKDLPEVDTDIDVEIPELPAEDEVIDVEEPEAPAEDEVIEIETPETEENGAETELPEVNEDEIFEI